MRVVYMLFWRFEIVLLRKYITLHRLKDQICASFWDQVNIYPFGQFLNPQNFQQWQRGFDMLTQGSTLMVAALGRFLGKLVSSNAESIAGMTARYESLLESRSSSCRGEKRDLASLLS